MYEVYWLSKPPIQTTPSNSQLFDVRLIGLPVDILNFTMSNFLKISFLYLERVSTEGYYSNTRVHEALHDHYTKQCFIENDTPDHYPNNHHLHSVRIFLVPYEQDSSGTSSNLDHPDWTFSRLWKRFPSMKLHSIGCTPGLNFCDFLWHLLFRRSGVVSKSVYVDFLSFCWMQGTRPLIFIFCVSR